jgi:hypothetical protein
MEQGGGRGAHRRLFGIDRHQMSGFQAGTKRVRRAARVPTHQLARKALEQQGRAALHCQFGPMICLIPIA